MSTLCFSAAPFQSLIKLRKLRLLSQDASLLLSITSTFDTVKLDVGIIAVVQSSFCFPSSSQSASTLHTLNHTVHISASLRLLHAAHLLHRSLHPSLHLIFTITSVQFFGAAQISISAEISGVCCLSALCMDGFTFLHSFQAEELMLLLLWLNKYRLY